jgi:hypothetical protein
MPFLVFLSARSFARLFVRARRRLHQTNPSRRTTTAVIWFLSPFFPLGLLPILGHSVKPFSGVRHGRVLFLFQFRVDRCPSRLTSRAG